MKKRFLTASLATMMVLSLAACGGHNNSSGSNRGTGRYQGGGQSRGN